VSMPHLPRSILIHICRGQHRHQMRLGIYEGTPINVEVPQLSHVLGEGGQSIFNGARGPFAMVQGTVDYDVLQWLRKEVVQDCVGLSFKKTAKVNRKARDRAVENQVKVEVAGHLEGHRLDWHLCCRREVLESWGSGLPLGYSTQGGCAEAHEKLEMAPTRFKIGLPGQFGAALRSIVEMLRNTGPNFPGNRFQVAIF
jgi:hypothetical protein